MSLILSRAKKVRAWLVYVPGAHEITAHRKCDCTMNRVQYCKLHSCFMSVKCMRCISSGKCIIIIGEPWRESPPHSKFNVGLLVSISYIARLFPVMMKLYSKPDWKKKTKKKTIDGCWLSSGSASTSFRQMYVAKVGGKLDGNNNIINYFRGIIAGERCGESYN